MNAITISPTEFRANQKKYLDMAETTRVFIKRGRKLVELVVSEGVELNPSPSGDKWFDDPRNMAEIVRRIKEYEAGETNAVPLEQAREQWQNM